MMPLEPWSIEQISNPWGPRRRRPLHEEEVAGGAVRIPLHHHRAVLDVRQERPGDVRVVLEQVAFGQAQLGPEHLAEVGEPDFLPLERQDYVVLVTRDDEAHVSSTP